jgi:hypothetical protein
MKVRVIIACAAVIAVGIIIFTRTVGQNRAPNQFTQPDFVSEPARSLDVDEFMTNIDHYNGLARIVGVVSEVWPEKEMLALIDVSEFKNCGVTDCARLTLPVCWPGSMPVDKDIVLVEGEVKESEEKLVFIAHTLEKVELESVGSP